MMVLLPAIDVYDGKAVRLMKGDYNKMTVYGDDPVRFGKDFARCGAGWIHMVDLEGAKSGTTPNLPVICRVARETGLKVEVGGGIRSMEVVDRYLSSGISRVILGTAAVTDPDFLARALAAYGEKIAVGIDLKDGYVAIKGWTQQSAYTCDEFFAKMEQMGVKTIICTDVSRDGAMAGTNGGLYRDLSEKFSVNLIASGGVSTMEDIRQLRAMKIAGAIVGKAYYTGDIDLKEAIEVAR